MGTFKLDGKELTFEAGDTIIRAAWRNGIEIPHYCWHPGLSVAANCRMCLVEIKSARPMLMPILRWDEAKKDYVDATKPKLVPACQQVLTDGMEVFAESDNAKKAHQDVQEFLLLNHPVDCPICDQAGECKLQDYWLEHQHKGKRKRSEPVHKPKAVRFGPTIVYDAERCIMCTRCVRFCDEVVGDHVLDMRERGNRNEITVSQGRELDHKYTLMTEHVCPVGALTSRDFRFKARVWFLKSVPGVCAGCATGCNTFVDFDPRNQTVYRLRPRDNEQVNEFWMCDDGMMTYKRVHEGRVTSGVVDGALTSRDEALAAAAESLRGIDGSRIAIVVSAQHASEDNFVLAKLARETLGASRFYLAALGGWDGDAILRHHDNNPNRAGALGAVGGPAPGVAELPRAVAAGEIDAVIALGWAAASTKDELAALGKAKAFVSLTSNEGSLPAHAKVIVPVASFAEMSGTFVNAQGMSQEFKKAILPPPGVKTAWETLIELATLLGKPLSFSKLTEVRSALPPPQRTPTIPPPEARA